MFVIRIKYMDGNSFGTHETSDTIPYVWKSLEKVKAARDEIIRLHNAGKEDYNVLLELDDGTMHPFYNFWDFDYFTRMKSIRIELDEVGDEQYV